LDYLQPLQVLVFHSEVASLFSSIQTHEPSVNWTSSTMWVFVANLNHTPLVSSRFVYASLFIFRVGNFYFDLLPFVHDKKNHVN
jgi:hypothetical protein